MRNMMNSEDSFEEDEEVQPRLGLLSSGNFSIKELNESDDVDKSFTFSLGKTCWCHTIDEPPTAADVMLTL